MTDAQLPDKTADRTQGSDNTNGSLPPDDTLGQLVSEHHRLDERVRHLSSLALLSSEQQYEEASLKKQKLALKDRIEAIVRHRYATQH